MCARQHRVRQSSTSGAARGGEVAARPGWRCRFRALGVAVKDRFRQLAWRDTVSDPKDAPDVGLGPFVLEFYKAAVELCVRSPAGHQYDHVGSDTLCAGELRPRLAPVVGELPGTVVERPCTVISSFSIEPTTRSVITDTSSSRINP